MSSVTDLSQDRKVILQLCALLVSSSQPQFRLFSLSEVSSNLAETDVDVVLINGRDDDVSPEPTAILTVAPALIFHPAFTQANLKFFLRLPRPDIFLAIEN
ncbi:hypothetical protein HG530_001534 [Fusarium avenaceum]|nr:hypothetical protein HG530_001534 [Fusarium avenaceum]